MNLNLFEFNEDDLKSNQRGMVTARQKEWLAGMGQGMVRVSRFNAWIALGFILFGTCLTFGLYMSNENSRRAFFASPINIILFPVIVVIGVGVIALSIFLARRLANKLSAPQLKMAEGKARLEEDSSGNTGGITYLAYIGRKKFAFGDSVNNLFQEGDKYRLYYCKTGVLEFVLSYEKLNT